MKWLCIHKKGWLPATAWDGSKQVDSREHWRAYVVDEGVSRPRFDGKSALFVHLDITQCKEKEMSKFKLGDVVVSIHRNEDSSQQVLKVIDSDDENHTVLLEDSDPDILNAWHSNEEYELVTGIEDITQEYTPQTLNTPNLDEATIHSELGRMMNEITQRIARHVDGKNIHLSIKSNYYSGSDLEIEFSVRIGGYGDTEVTASNLREAGDIALQQWLQVQDLKPLAIGVMRNE